MVEKAIEHGFDKAQFITWDKWDSSMVEKCKRNGIKTNICAINNPDDLKFALDAGFDCIMTDDPELMQSILNEYK